MDVEHFGNFIIDEKLSGGSHHTQGDCDLEKRNWKQEEVKDACRCHVIPIRAGLQKPKPVVRSTDFFFLISSVTWNDGCLSGPRGFAFSHLISEFYMGDLRRNPRRRFN